MIPFPIMNIAASVINRIQNTLEQDGPLGIGRGIPDPVSVEPQMLAPNPDPIGQAIDQKIAEPVQPVAVPPEKETDANSGMLGASVMGGSPFDGALIGMGL